MACADVVIIGAGLAGLAAAKQLISSNSPSKHKIIILEARERVGGRTESVVLPIEEQSSIDLSNIVDVGGQWIGPGQDRILDLVNEYDLDLTDQFYLPPTGEITESLVECINLRNPPLDKQSIIEIRHVMKLIDRYSELIDVEAPWNHPKANEFDNISITDFIEQETTSPVANREISLLIQTVMACSGSACSFLFFLFYIKSGGGIVALGDGDHGAQKWKLSGGLQQISDLMLQDIINSGFGSIVFADPVVHILNSRTKGNRNINQFEIKTKSGTVYYSKDIIVAMAPHLAISSITFTPPLPKGETELFGSMNSGHAVKVIMIFKTAFWLKDEEFQAPKHFCDLGYMHNIFHAEVGNYPALVGLITGDAALEYEKIESEEQRKQMNLKQIRDMYCSYRGKLDLVYFIEKLWARDEFAGGCFAGVFPPTGVYTKLGPKYLINQSLKRRYPLDDSDSTNNTWDTLQWACTELSSEFYGYAEGAIRSGERAALRLLEHSLNSCL